MSDVSPNKFSSKSSSSKGTNKKWKSSKRIYLLCLVVMIITVPLFVLVLAIIAGVSSSLTLKLSEVNTTSMLHELKLIQNKYFSILSLSGLITDGNSNLSKLIRGFSMNSSLKDSTENKRIDFILNTTIVGNEVLVYPPPSCRAISISHPTYKSGYYWVATSSGRGRRRVYCDMTKICGNITGGLTRAAVLNYETRPHFCTRQFQRIDKNSKCIRSIVYPGCSHIVFPALNTYSHICGTVESYYQGSPDGFNRGRGHFQMNINDYYVDGISLTYGHEPRHHLWTFVAQHYGKCAQNKPTFVRNNFSCLKQECKTSPCIHSFSMHLQKPIMENIELRLCQDEAVINEVIIVGNLEIYVR